jgi:transposase-like protein
MIYQEFLTENFFSNVSTEQAAVETLWSMKFEGKAFTCKSCQGEQFQQYKCNHEIRKCVSCGKHNRLRTGTIFENSKIDLLKWLRAIYFVMQGKRGVSALELMRHLGMKSYGTVWSMLHRIREALRQRDESYKLKGQIELDGAVFGRRETGTRREVLVAVETKDWIDHKGKPKSKAGFAKVLVANETKENAQVFADAAIDKGSMINTDGSPSLRNIDGHDVDYQVVSGKKDVLNSWLPWVHKTISNAKAWIIGTHHGIGDDYLESYLAEYFFRFNRRHDAKRMFHRATMACLRAKPVNLGTLLG